MEDSRRLGSQLDALVIQPLNGHDHMTHCRREGNRVSDEGTVRMENVNFPANVFIMNFFFLHSKNNMYY